MTTRSNKEDFIEKAEKIHGDKYDYHSSTYVNSKHKVEINCKLHGSFWQTPSDHLSGRGCPNCRYISSAKSNSSTTEEFIEKANKIHNHRYDYSFSKYVNSHTKIKIACKAHGQFLQIPRDHLSGSGCYKCGHENRTLKVSLSTEDFIRKAMLVHDRRYNYSEVDYINSQTKVKILCRVHGEFLQTPNNHLKGDGCPSCGRELIGWVRTRYENLVNKFGAGNLYVVELSNDLESFIKIGITVKGFKSRFQKSRIPYTANLLYEVTLTDGGILFDLEKYLFRQLKEFKYKPELIFNGYTECFKGVDLQDIKSTIDEFLYKDHYV